MKHFPVFFFLFIPIFVVAQAPTYSIYGGPSYTNTTAEDERRETNSLVFINDSIIGFIPARQEVFFTIKDKLGFELGASAQFSLSQDLSINTGIGLNFRRFDLETSFGENIQIPGADTIFQSRNPIVFTPTLCDEFEPIQDPLNLNPAVAYSILYLQIPLNAQFAISNSFMITAGVQLSTPIYTRVARDFILGTTREETDENGNSITICGSELSELVDHSGNGFSNFVLEVNFGATYQINDRLGVEARFSRNLRNIFAEATTGFSFANTVPNIVMYQASIRMHYTLGKIKTIEEEG